MVEEETCKESGLLGRGTHNMEGGTTTPTTTTKTTTTTTTS